METEEILNPINSIYDADQENKRLTANEYY